MFWSNQDAKVNMNTLKQSELHILNT